ncbi:unnamed protein product [Orchesella dallaii]|uniref:Uncharacterized protein n=1 Tax=Orchesella dallaii TaxID=48710 RepID=A0ABP1QXW1_9HEXA
MASSSKHFSTTPVSILKNRSAFSTSRDDGADGKLTGVLDEGAQGGDSMSTPQNTRKVSFNQEADHIKIFENDSSFHSDTSAGCTPNSSNYSRRSDSSPPEVINETLEDEDDLDMSLLLPEDRKGDGKTYVPAFVIDSPLLDIDTSQSIMGTSDEEPETCPSPEKRKKKMRKARSTTLPESNSRPLDFPLTQVNLNPNQQYQQRSFQKSRSRADLEPQPGPSRKANNGMSSSMNFPVKKPNPHAYRIFHGAEAGTSTKTSHSFGPFASTITPKRHRLKKPNEPDEKPIATSPPPIPAEVKTPETKKFPSPSPNPVVKTPHVLPDPASYTYQTPEQPIRIGINCDDPQPKRKIVSAINTPRNNISSMRRHHQQTLESIPENIPDESQSQNVSSPSPLDCTGSYENDSSMESGSDLAGQLEEDARSQSEEEIMEESTEIVENDLVSTLSDENESPQQDLSLADSSLGQNNININDNNNNIDLNDVNNNIDINAAPSTTCSNSQCAVEYLNAEIQRFIQSNSDHDDRSNRMYCFMKVLEIQLAKLPEVEFNTILDRYSTFFGETYINSIHCHRRMYTDAVGCRMRRMIYGSRYGLSVD